MHGTDPKTVPTEFTQFKIEGNDTVPLEEGGLFKQKKKRKHGDVHKHTHRWWKNRKHRVILAKVRYPEDSADFQRAAASISDTTIDVQNDSTEEIKQLRDQYFYEIMVNSKLKKDKEEEEDENGDENDEGKKKEEESEYESIEEIKADSTLSKKEKRQKIKEKKKENRRKRKEEKRKAKEEKKKNKGEATKKKKKDKNQTPKEDDEESDDEEEDVE